MKFFFANSVEIETTVQNWLASFLFSKQVIHIVCVTLTVQSNMTKYFGKRPHLTEFYLIFHLGHHRDPI